MTETTELIDHWRAEEERLVRAAMLMDAQANIDDALVRADLARRTVDALSTSYLEDAAKETAALREALVAVKTRMQLLGRSVAPGTTQDAAIYMIDFIDRALNTLRKDG